MPRPPRKVPAVRSSCTYRLIFPSKWIILCVEAPCNQPLAIRLLSSRHPPRRWSALLAADPGWGLQFHEAHDAVVLREVDMRPNQLATADTHLGVLTLTKGRVTRLIILSLAIAAGLAIAGALPLALSASGGSTITVCPSGPPACDFQTIQQGLQAAAAGDTVLVAPGEYLGPIKLKSQVTLRSSHGEEVTVILADTGPIVHAEDVVSATSRASASTDGPP